MNYAFQGLLIHLCDGQKMHTNDFKLCKTFQLLSFINLYAMQKRANLAKDIKRNIFYLCAFTDLASFSVPTCQRQVSTWGL